MENLQIKLLYSIKTDDAQQCQLDKIDFLNKNTKQFYDTIKDDLILQVKGLFGTQHDIEREIEQELNNKVSLQSYINHSEKGNLIAIKLQNQMLYCLILSEKFFITKPINEKAIEIVLFRILQDLTENIKLCLNDSILKQNWYQEEVIPFSAQMLQTNEYDFAEEQNQEVKLYDCKLVLSSDLSDYEIINSNSKTLSPKLTTTRSIKFDEDDFKGAYNEFYQKLLIQIFSTENKEINYLKSLIKREYQNQNLNTILTELSKELEEVVGKNRKKFFEQLQHKKQHQQNQNDEEDPKKNIEADFNDIWQKIEYQKESFSYTNQHHEFKKDIKKFLCEFNQNIQNIKKKYLFKIKEVVDQQLMNQTYYEIMTVSFKLNREEDNLSEQVKNIVQNDNEKKIISDNFFHLQIPTKFNIIDVFDTKEKSTIYIIKTQHPNTQTKIFFQSHNSHQCKLMNEYQFKDKEEQAVYFYDYNRGHLYIFNFKGFQVHQIIITEHGVITSENCICYQQENYQEFVISQVAFLYHCNKFIVFSKDKKLYKQKDQGQDFENVKYVDQLVNGTKHTDSIKKINPEEVYTQLHTCPSGKCFYLANNKCCDRYDLNCMRIESIEIAGSIKIFADFSDVIILGQLKKKSQNAKIISNLVSQKKFNKQENQEKKAIGNPALDIVKGSLIKFGPNSQFLFKEKKRNINIYINKEYYDIIEPYLNIMNMNEILLSSSKLQFAEYKSEQIKNIIFSRVPLQLCTIENSNLIPLNDGFRRQSQTQTIISVDQKVKQLHLGFLEDHLSNYNNKIFVVGIIGRQSSGKSYLLNRVFGTRFSVSSARCTDGVWGSIACIEDQTFLVLDCEGLFNGARTDKEEIKMLAFLTSLCDITILNSEQFFNRHYKDLFNHLVEASKQLNDEKLFKGIIYFIIRDVSSNDNKDVEQELLKNLESLKKHGSEEIVFLKRLFNNKIAIKKLVNNENQQFDQQLIAVRQYFLDNSRKSNRWKNGIELVQIMKILLCQLELSDNTNASLIELQIRIEKIFEESKELWYKFDLNEIKSQNLKLYPSQYQFQKFNDHEYILMCKDVLKQLYKDLALEDSIQTHNKHLQEAKSQFNQMMEFRKEQIILRTKQETSCIDNQEVQIMIQNKMSKLHSFLVDQINQYEFCLVKCNQCHLFCKQFKNHIEISQQLNQSLNDQINSLENQRKNSQIKNEDQEEERRKKMNLIDIDIKNNENKLEVLKIYNQIYEIKNQKQQEENEIMKYDFYDNNQKCLNLSFFQIDQNEKYQHQTVPLDNIEELQNKIKQQIPELQIKKEEVMEIINKQQDLLNNYERDSRDKEQSLNLIKISQKNQQSEMNESNQQQIENKKKLENIQSQILEIDISNDENDIKLQQFNIEQKTQRLHQISNQVKEYQQKEKEKTQELQQLKQTDLILYFDNLNKNIQEYQQNSNQLEEEIENLEKQKNDLEKIKKEQSKKFGKDQKKIEDLTKKLNGINEEQIQNQLNQCQIRKENLENTLENVENFELLKRCQEQIETGQLDIQILEQEISQQENQIQGDQNGNNEIQQFQESENAKNQQLVNLFLKNKEEQLNEIQTLVSSNLKEIQEINISIDQSEQIIGKITKKNNLLDTQKNLNFEISEIEEGKIEFEIKQQETIRQLNTQEQDLVEIKKNYEQLIQDNKNLLDEYNKLDLNINKLNSQVNKLVNFSVHLNDYKVHSETLKEKQIQLEKCVNFESFKELEQQQILTQIEDLNEAIDDSKEEKEKLMKQLQNFNQSAIDAEKLKNLQDTQKKLVELELNLHLCQRESHKCDQVCQACPDKICDNKAGHDEQQEHLCNKQNHRCNDQCEIIYCQSRCNKILKHDSKHNCLNDHPCREKCEYCQKNCKRDVSADPHYTVHNCLDNYCVENCKLCNRKCCESHQHSKEKSNHFCESVHQCQEFCQENGICKIEYEVNEATWKTQFSEFKYIQYKPICNKKQKCQKQIPEKSYNHDGNHQCKDQTQNQFHQCDQQCPECNTYCDLKYGHPGFHSSDRHRNKENQIFTIQEGNNQVQIKIQDQSEQKIRKYQVGESSNPETCDQSCKRRGRAHFHLVTCQGVKNCLENKSQYKARHSKDKYVQFEHLSFDEVLCIDFWKLKNWFHPIVNELSIINNCDYYCPLCQQQQSPYSFCNQDAWHTYDDKIQAHSFSCKQSHLENQIQGINIAFVIDTTKSMKEYIIMCKDTIKEIMKRTKAQKTANREELDIKFAVVSYNDHSYVNKIYSPNCLKTQNFASDKDIISFLEQLTLEHSSDEPEAVLDGLNASIKLNWNQNYEKLLYLIADAPPHGKQYTNLPDNYPNGCPCGLQQEQILPVLKNMRVKFKIFKFTQKIDMMITEFQKDFKDLKVLTPDDIKDQENFKNIIVYDICEHLTQNEITYQMENKK